jgi:hypothetical protein
MKHTATASLWPDKGCDAAYSNGIRLISALTFMPPPRFKYSNRLFFCDLFLQARYFRVAFPMVFAVRKNSRDFLRLPISRTTASIFIPANRH